MKTTSRGQSRSWWGCECPSSVQMGSRANGARPIIAAVARFKRRWVFLKNVRVQMSQSWHLVLRPQILSRTVGFSDRTCAILEFKTGRFQMSPAARHWLDSTVCHSLPVSHGLCLLCTHYDFCQLFFTVLDNMAARWRKTLDSLGFLVNKYVFKTFLKPQEGKTCQFPKTPTYRRMRQVFKIFIFTFYWTQCAVHLCRSADYWWILTYQDSSMRFFLPSSQTGFESKNTLPEFYDDCIL